jgi:YbgC/YbaW family acyl-CoA thioester hydrolase
MLFTHEFKTSIQPEQLDFYGHLNNAQYLQILESARWNWIEKFGGTRELVTKLGVGPIVLEINIQFLKELKAAEEILIRSKREVEVGRLFYQEQEIINSRSEVACKARLKMGFLNLQTRRLVEPPFEWCEILEERSVSSL